MIDLTQFTGFVLDEGNARKRAKCGVSMADAGRIFFSKVWLHEKARSHW